MLRHYENFKTIRNTVQRFCEYVIINEAWIGKRRLYKLIDRYDVVSSSKPEPSKLHEFTLVYNNASIGYYRMLTTPSMISYCY